MSSPQTPLDLNLSISGQVAGNTISWQPSSESTPISIISNDSVIVNPAIALRFADQLLTPRDQELLARRSDYAAADESTWLNIQAAASVTNLCHRLRARVRENESLRIQLTLLRKLQQDLNTRMDRLRKEKKEYKKENKVLKEENRKASLIISRYQTEMKTKLDALQASGERLEIQHKRLIVDIPSASNSQP